MHGKRRGVGPRAALHGPARRNRGGRPAAGEVAGHAGHPGHVAAPARGRLRARQDLGEAVENLLRFLVLRRLQVGVHLVVPRVQPFADVVPRHGGVVRADVGVDRLLPRADAREGVRRHVERVRRVGREVRVLPRVGQRARRERRHVVAVNQIVRDAGMIGLHFVEPLEDRGGLQLVRVGLVGGRRRLIDGEGVERGGLAIVRILRRELRHRLLVGERPRAVIECGGVLVEQRDGGDVGALAIGFRADRLRLLRRDEAVLQHLRRAQAGERVAPRRHRDPPLCDAARRIVVEHFLEAGDRVGELERVQERDRVIELLRRGGRARGCEMDLSEPLAAGARRLRANAGRGEHHDHRRQDRTCRTHIALLHEFLERVSE